MVNLSQSPASVKLTRPQLRALVLIASPASATFKIWLHSTSTRKTADQQLLDMGLIRLAQPGDSKWKEIVVTEAGRKVLDGSRD